MARKRIVNTKNGRLKSLIASVLSVPFIIGGVANADEKSPKLSKCSQIESNLEILRIKHNVFGPKFCEEYREIINELVKNYENCDCGSTKIDYEPPFGSISEFVFERDY